MTVKRTASLSRRIQASLPSDERDAVNSGDAGHWGLFGLRECLLLVKVLIFRMEALNLIIVIEEESQRAGYERS